jgi:hypothetical protein
MPIESQLVPHQVRSIVIVENRLMQSDLDKKSARFLKNFSWILNHHIESMTMHIANSDLHISPSAEITHQSPWD